MTTEEIIGQLNPIFKDVLDNDDIVVTTATSAADVDEWDSLVHIQLVVAIEKHFKIKFNAREIQTWKNVGDIIVSIQAKHEMKG